MAGGYDPRLEDNMMCFVSLIDRVKANSLTYDILQPGTSKVNIPPFQTTKENPSVTFLLNFTTSQRSALLSSPSTLAILYTPENEHFGIGPVEGMVCGVPVLACNSGGPTESVVDSSPEERTGWLRKPDPDAWAEALLEIVSMSKEERAALGERARARGKAMFGMEAMAKGIESALEQAIAMGPVNTLTWLWIVLLTLFCVPLTALFAFR